MENRVPTGIPGFDEMIGGGLPRGRTILLSGTCGTGKTTFAVQYLVTGAVKYNEPGVLVTLEQNADELRHDMQSLGFDMKRLEDEGKLVIVDVSLGKVGLKDYLTEMPASSRGSFSLRAGEFGLENLTAVITDTAKKAGAKRIVIDSLPALDFLIKENTEVRRTLLKMNYEFKEHGLTTILITEGSDEDSVSEHGVEEYITDGVIVMRINEALDTRIVKIRKMRLTKHSLKPVTFEFTPQGIAVKSSR